MSQTMLSKILKAAYSGSIAFLGTLSTALSGSAGFGDVTDGQWTGICLFTVAAIGGTFGLAGWVGPRINGGPKSDR